MNPTNVLDNGINVTLNAMEDVLLSGNATDDWHLFFQYETALCIISHFISTYSYYSSVNDYVNKELTLLNNCLRGAKEEIKNYSRQKMLDSIYDIRELVCPVDYTVELKK